MEHSINIDLLFQVSNGGGGPPAMNIVPSRWVDNKVKDVVLFHLTLVGAPIFAAIAYANTYIGPAK